MSMRAHRQGFSLLEMSVVLAIIAVVVSYGVTVGSAAIKGSDRLTTRERLSTIQKAIEVYAKTNGFLPCPADRALTPGNANYGKELRDNTTHVDCVPAGGMVRAPSSGSPFVYIGAVPVRNLGLPDVYAGDAWSNKFLYAVSAPHVGDMSSYITTDGVIVVQTGDRTGTHYPITTVRNNAAAGYNDTPGAAATYVVLSHGPDGKGSYPVNGTAVGTACGSSNNNDVENCDDGNVTFYDSPYNDGIQESTFFDDYIVWGTNALSRMPKADAASPGCGSGSCESWCVTCSNTPVTSTNMICSRTITTTAPCQALCVYAYPANHVFCP
jgi:prepilin-type N-terminal cleavage/methylation domain-containing protein